MSDTNQVHKLIIIGSGPSGWVAAIYAARALLNPLLFEGPQPGGQLTITSDVENFPGFPEGITGPELMERCRKQAERFGTTVVADWITAVDFSARPFQLKSDQGKTFLAESIIITSGASARWLGLPSEQKFMGRGVSGCATCDGFFFKNKDICVVGGGDSAMEEATFLTRFAKSVTIIHRKDSFKASRVMIEKAKANPKIRFELNQVVEEILGDTGVTAIRLKNIDTNDVRTLPMDGVFIAIGHQPNTSFIKGQLRLQENGYVWVEPGTCKTSVPGVFAAGDVADHVYRQAVTAAGTGCMAALEAERFLESQTH
jgi:thioredoxin reductase (NADPH)